MELEEEWNVRQFEKMLKEYDDTVMDLPCIDEEPHLLMSKVRKFYLDHVIKLLSVNYETSQKLEGKNVYLPSAIWRCAKYIEINAVRACMVVDLYRRNILSVINDLKADTQKGKLNKMLNDCILKPPKNEKMIQVTLEQPVNCNCSDRLDKKRKKCFPNLVKTNIHDTYNKTITSKPVNKQCIEEIEKQITVENQSVDNPIGLELKNGIQTSSCVITPRPSVESLDSMDQIMLQLEQLFNGDTNEDELFDKVLNTSNLHIMQDSVKINTNGPSNTTLLQENTSEANGTVNNSQTIENNNHDSLTENNKTANEQTIKSLDERLAQLEFSSILNTNNTQVDSDNKTKKKSYHNNKWLCESYFQKLQLYEKMDEIRDNNRKKYWRIKSKFIILFGKDDEDEDIMSPLEETPEFALSCKDRMAPWIVKILTPHYVKGRIRGKALFKSLARHLLKLIYQCSRYPSQYEVNSFVTDFLKSHKMIRCEADFKEFRIENI